MKKPDLLSQVLAVNVLLVAATVIAASAAARLDLSIATDRRQFAVLACAILVTLLANALILRRRFAPLAQLVETAEHVDLAQPGLRVPVSRADSREVARLHAAFNRMLDRIEAERGEAGRAVLQGQEEERRRLARDLHDEVNQALTAILLRLEASAHDAPPELARELAETKRLATQAMQELLALARELRPAALDDHGLLPALQSQARDFGERTGIPAVFTTHGEPRPLSGDEQIAVYRVAQESLSNVVRHAGAGQVEIELAFGERTTLRVRDDGRGFDPERDAGLGLTGMRERALLAGGRLAIESLAGRGTIVELELPEGTG